MVPITDVKRDINKVRACARTKNKKVLTISTFFVGREVIRKLYIRIILIFCSCKSRGKIRWMFAHYFEGD